MVFFHIMHDGLSERGTTHSLIGSAHKRHRFHILDTPQSGFWSCKATLGLENLTFTERCPVTYKSDVVTVCLSQLKLWGKVTFYLFSCCLSDTSDCSHLNTHRYCLVWESFELQVHIWLQKPPKLLKVSPLPSPPFRGRSRGRVQGVCTPPWDDLRLSNTTGILQIKRLVTSQLRQSLVVHPS